MMVTAWVVIIFFAVTFLLKVIRTPQNKSENGETANDHTEQKQRTVITFTVLRL